jgi:peroxiredoxin Q/BCP
MPAPQFEMPDADGRSWQLDELRGQKVVLYFYPIDDTPGCTTEACDFRDTRDNFAGAGYQVLGVSPQDADSHKGFSSKYSLNFPLLIDEGMRVAAAYGTIANDAREYEGTPIEVTRSTFVIDEHGHIESAEYGVRAKGHVARLREQLGI